jgi:hypothetical protein
MLPFLGRARRRDRLFKGVVLGSTIGAVAAMLAFLPSGRYAAALVGVEAPERVRRLMGYPASREAMERRLRLQRRRGIEATTALYERVERESPPALQRLLRLSGLAPGEALLRWGDFDHTLLLSAKVHEADERRSYRLRPRTRAFWVQRLALRHALTGVLLVPDTPEVRQAARAAGGRIVEDSVQTTNSWGLRGPEPDPRAALRVMVLGDSFMQGMLLGDADTPPARLEEALRSAFGPSVSVLNAGHVGYAIEHYARMYEEFAPRFRPHAVVVAVCVNDLGAGLDACRGGGPDWELARYWLEWIQQECRTGNIPCLVATIPPVEQIEHSRRHPFFPARVVDLATGGPDAYCDPLDAFVGENLRLRLAARRQGRILSRSPLYLGHLEDGHFSRDGARLWGELVGRRLAGLIEWKRRPR